MASKPVIHYAVHNGINPKTREAIKLPRIVNQPILSQDDIVSFSASGCSSLTPSDKTQTMGVYAFGIPGIAVISQTTQAADNKGEDSNVPVQVNPVGVKP